MDEIVIHSTQREERQAHTCTHTHTHTHARAHVLKHKLRLSHWVTILRTLFAPKEASIVVVFVRWSQRLFLQCRLSEPLLMCGCVGGECGGCESLSSVTLHRSPSAESINGSSSGIFWQ